MAIKVYKRNHAGRRNMSIVKPDDLTDQKPQKNLLVKVNKKAGRSHGKISVRHRGGGSKKRYRMVDFKQDKLGIPGIVASIEKDPYRSVLIALIVYKDGEKRYILANKGLKKGMEVVSDEKAPFQIGNRMKIKNIPVGTPIFNIEMTPGKGGQMARSAGASVTLMGVENKMAQLKMASGEIRLVKNECYATIGQASNFEHNAVKIGKAGRKRRMGIRPTVRGSAMNPVDHPHGGGEGRQPVGLKYPKTPWGKNAFGVKTRKKNKKSNKYIIKKRK